MIVANAETDLQQRIRLALGTRPDTRLFRNQVGSLPDPRTGRLVTFGLARGSADLIGWRTVTVTPDMVGQRLAVFTSIEVKTPTGRVAPAQRHWLNAVHQAGGIAGIARSTGDALRIVTDGCQPCQPLSMISQPASPMDEAPRPPQCPPG